MTCSTPSQYRVWRMSISCTYKSQPLPKWMKVKPAYVATPFFKSSRVTGGGRGSVLDKFKRSANVRVWAVSSSALSLSFIDDRYPNVTAKAHCAEKPLSSEPNDARASPFAKSTAFTSANQSLFNAMSLLIAYPVSADHASNCSSISCRLVSKVAVEW